MICLSVCFLEKQQQGRFWISYLQSMSVAQHMSLSQAVDILSNVLRKALDFRSKVVWGERL